MWIYFTSLVRHRPEQNSQDTHNSITPIVSWEADADAEISVAESGRLAVLLMLGNDTRLNVTTDKLGNVQHVACDKRSTQFAGAASISRSYLWSMIPVETNEKLAFMNDSVRTGGLNLFAPMNIKSSQLFKAYFLQFAVIYF